VRRCMKAVSGTEAAASRQGRRSPLVHGRAAIGLQRLS
jgi:hypothetical protein